MNQIALIKSRLTVLDLWRKLYPGSAPKSDLNSVYHSPFRDDKAPSFSIFDSGRRFKDQATGDGGDCIDFAMLAFQCSKADAVRRLGEDVGALPERKLPPSVGKKPLDKAEYERLRKKCLADFKLVEGTVIYNFLKTKGISFDVAVAMNKEGSLGCYWDMPAYIYANGIKVRHSAQSSRSTRWLIGSDGGVPWRYGKLSPKTEIVIVTEGESDAMLSMSCVKPGRHIRVIAWPNATCKPDQSILDSIGNGRRVFVLADNDEAGRKMRMWLKEHMPNVTCYALGEWGQDLCDIGQVTLRYDLERILINAKEQRPAGNHE